MFTIRECATRQGDPHGSPMTSIIQYNTMAPGCKCTSTRLTSPHKIQKTAAYLSVSLKQKFMVHGISIPFLSSRRI